MSEFVNYQKRAITLPPGCKDLIDVLEPSRRGTLADKIGQTPQIKERHFRTNGLAQIGRFVRIFSNSSANFTVMIVYRDDRTPVMLHRNSIASVIMVPADNDDRARDIRNFFEQEVIQSFEDWMPPSCTEAGGESYCLCYRLPSDPLDATRLITNLLRQVFGLSDFAGLDFQYYEF